MRLVRKRQNNCVHDRMKQKKHDNSRIRGYAGEPNRYRIAEGIRLTTFESLWKLATLSGTARYEAEDS